MNGQYIQRMGADEWVAASRPWLVQAGASEADINARPEWYAKLYPLVSERLQRLDEVPAKLAYMFWGANVAELDEKSVKKVLLKEGCTVRQAGIEVGMNDPYHFSKTFKNIVGMSPSAYSKTALK